MHVTEKKIYRNMAEWLQKCRKCGDCLRNWGAQYRYLEAYEIFSVLGSLLSEVIRICPKNSTFKAHELKVFPTPTPRNGPVIKISASGSSIRKKKSVKAKKFPIKLFAFSYQYLCITEAALIRCEWRENKKKPSKSKRRTQANAV